MWRRMGIVGYVFEHTNTRSLGNNRLETLNIQNMVFTIELKNWYPNPLWQNHN